MNPVQFFKCLADETRLYCLLLIEREGELCVCELTQALQQIQPKVSRHLAMLRQHQLLLDRKQGQWVFYRINPELPAWAQAVLTTACEHNTVFLSEALQQLQTMGDRPQRRQDCC